MSGYDVNLPDQPSPDEEAASLSSLALAPWVEERARPLRDAHMAARRAETECNTSSKVSKWRRLGSRQSGGHHRE